MLTYTVMTNMSNSIRRKTFFHIVMALLVMLLLLPTPALAETPFTILITSNLQGKFSLEIDKQETADPLLLLGQNIIFERKQGVDLYLDMGNALYPGILSKYSSGSVMMDFLDYFSCEALLVSSKDLQIGTKNLQFLQKDKKVGLLSSNIVQENNSIFTPWFTVDRRGTQVAFIGVSSDKIRFDVAEKDLYGYQLVEVKEVLKPILNDIRAAGIKHIVLLSGQNLRDTVAILKAFPDIGLALGGGDYTGRLFGDRASRLDLADGRTIVMADDKADYYLLQLVISDTIKVKKLEKKIVAPLPTTNYAYREFKNRLTLWKEKFLEDENRLVENLDDTEYRVDDQHFAQLLRDRFDCELGVVEEDTLNPVPINRNINHSDFLSMVNRDYHIFLFSLTGDELQTVHRKQEGLEIAGFVNDKELSIQGYPLVSDRPYRVAASQPAMQKIRRLLRKKIDYRNTWMTVTDLLMDDLKSSRIVLRANYEYLDRRFRTTIDAYLSNFIDNSTVDRGENIETPPGQPSKSYIKWGLENEIDIATYNKYHRFVFTPYMLYSRQDDSYLNNILRGIFLYDYNLYDTIKPYNKFQVDTVVEEVDGLRPLLLRETLGISTVHKYINGKLGIGFEKEAQDPSSAALYGIELIMGARIPFLSHFTYAFDLDSFTGIRNEDGGQRQLRSEINNAISVKINSHLSLSFRHKYFYKYEEDTGETYQNSQFITSLDVKNDWKFW
jgi:hypothetical protein